MLSQAMQSQSLKLKKSCTPYLLLMAPAAKPPAPRPRLSSPASSGQQHGLFLLRVVGSFVVCLWVSFSAGLASTGLACVLAKIAAVLAGRLLCTGPKNFPQALLGEVTAAWPAFGGSWARLGGGLTAAFVCFDSSDCVIDVTRNDRLFFAALLLSLLH